MKLIDEKGRLFGKINLIDLLVVILIVAVIAAVAWKLGGRKAAAAVTGSAKKAVTTRAAHCTCGGLWKLEADLPAFDLSGVDTHEWSLFRYRKFMALEDESWRAVTMGEGMTPVVRLDEDVLLKMDYFMPTLSFKDRGAAVLIAHCKSIGVDQVVQDSSGNAGNAVAAYCAKAGIACEIFVPEGTSPKKIDMIRAHGAVCTVVPGSRDHCADVCRAKVEQEGVYYANHVYNPFFYEGTKTYIYEVFEQLGRIPANLVIPVGNGTLFLGAIYALEHLQNSGVIDHFPQIIMRGIPSLITEIRKKVFTEVARMAYSGDYTDMEDIPFKIVP